MTMRRLRLASCLLLLPVLGCTDDGGGDDLPPGAFTSGPDDDDGTVFDSSTTQDSGATGPSTESGSTGPDDDSSSGPPPVVFHDQDILPIWMASCLGTACHSADGAQAAILDLETEGVYDRLCRSFHGQSGMPFIDCMGLDPQNSYVFRKIENTHLMGISGALGGPMPPGESLSDQQIATISAWISGGAMQ